MAGLFMLAVLAVAGLGTYTGQLPFAMVLARGMAAFETKGAEASTEKPAAEAAVVSPRAIRIITQTVAVSDPAPVPAAGGLSAVESTLAPSESNVVPAQAPSASSVAAKAAKGAGHGASQKHSNVKTACAAGQHLDRVQHKCVGPKRSSGDQIPKPLG